MNDDRDYFTDAANSLTMYEEMSVDQQEEWGSQILARAQAFATLALTQAVRQSARNLDVRSARGVRRQGRVA